MFGSKLSVFDKFVEKASSQLNLDTDWDTILLICDQIRQNEVTPKMAVSSIKKRIANENPHVSVHALEILESAVKNCGSSLHQEVASKEFLEFIKIQIRTRPEIVRDKLLEMVQAWANAFKSDSSLRSVQDTYNALKSEGFSFPEFHESEAMFKAEVAPDWKDGENCYKCVSAFGLMQRKHHCRHCGQVFCNSCSSKQCPIPKFGIEKDVRVCNTCFDLLNKKIRHGKKRKTAPKQDSQELPTEYLQSSLAKEQQKPQQSDQQFDDDTALAIALSKSLEESAAKLAVKPMSNSNIKMPSMDTTKEMDPELKKYLDTGYWKEKAKQNSLKQTTGTKIPDQVNGEAMSYHSGMAPSAPEVAPPTGATSEEEEEFLKTLRRSVEIFVNRMKSDAARGRSISHDSSVQTLFSTIAAMHPRLMALMAEQEERRTDMEGLQDQLMQMKDAREALDGLREEEREKRRIAAAEAQRQRQLAMNAKLTEYRTRKYDYLEFQRQQLQQRMMEQEMELANRIYHQRQMQQVRNMQWIPGMPPMNQQQQGQMIQSQQSQMNQIPSGQINQMQPGQMNQQQLGELNQQQLSQLNQQQHVMHGQTPQMYQQTPQQFIGQDIQQTTQMTGQYQQTTQNNQLHGNISSTETSPMHVSGFNQVPQNQSIGPQTGVPNNMNYAAPHQIGNSLPYVQYQQNSPQQIVQQPGENQLPNSNNNQLISFD